jgi:hypothetical protein
MDCREWRVNAANASALADTLYREQDRAILFRTLATLRTDIPLFDDVDQLRWKWPDNGLRRDRCSIGRSVYGKAAANDPSAGEQVGARPKARR